MPKQINPKLTEEQKKILFEKGTERPFSNDLIKAGPDGVFRCVNCQSALFDSSAKFDSGTGWPSFDKALDGAVKEIEDSSYGMRRVEVVCANCEAHLGHVFPDGPTETGQRYCINSVCLGY